MEDVRIVSGNPVLTKAAVEAVKKVEIRPVHGRRQAGKSTGADHFGFQESQKNELYEKAIERLRRDVGAGLW